MVFAYPFVKSKKNGSDKLICFTNTTGSAICRIFMKWQLICACRKNDPYLWKIMHTWLAQTAAGLESGNGSFHTRTTSQIKGPALISLSFLREKLIINLAFESQVKYSTALKFALLHSLLPFYIISALLQSIKMCSKHSFFPEPA
jgi:hypothetical protein